MRVHIALFMAMLLAVSAAGAANAQEEQAAQGAPFAFQGGIELGSDVLPTGPDDIDGNPTNEAWTRLGFLPDISFGKFGIGLDLSIRFKLYPEPDQAMEIYPGDWVPDYHDNGKTFLDVYLPKILYVRYGLKGEDPLFVKLGSIDDLTLGNGFIVGEYSNMRFMPEQRIFGLDFGIDGKLFDLPYVGFEALTGNLAQFDVIGGRLFARPLIGTEIPIVKNMQVGFTAAIDREPDLYDETLADADPIAVYGADVTVPIIGGKTFPLAAFADLAFEPNGTVGGMLGAGGRIIGIFTYGAQLRVLQDGFIPVYFDANYDLYRSKKYAYMQDDSQTDGSAFVGWYASLGTTLIEDKLVFKASLDGPFKAIPSVATDDQTDYPHAKAIFVFGEGIIGGIFFDASYEKYFIGAEDGFFEDLIDPTNAIIGLSINYKTGASVLTLNYDADWDPVEGKFNVSSSISASMKF